MPSYKPDENKYTEKALLDRLERNRKPLGGVYYWIFTVHNGKTVCIGFKSSEIEAEQYAYAKCPGEYIIYPFRTRDINTAIRLAKGQILHKTSDLDQAMQRFSRKPVNNRYGGK